METLSFDLKFIVFFSYVRNDMYIYICVCMRVCLCDCMFVCLRISGPFQ